MADVDRIIARLRRHPPEVDFRDLRQVLEAHGWRMGRLPMSIPLIGGRRVKRAYVRQVLKAIDEES
jgi:hypothetical protein